MSFFRLTPPAPRTSAPDDAQADWLASLGKPAYETVMQEAFALADALFEALDTYAAAHPDISYGVIDEALRFMRWSVDQEATEESADA